jgi:hydroxyacylglutathione hydrolase
MYLEKLVVGPLSANCYIVGDDNTREAAVIDPGGNGRDIQDACSRERLKLIAIVNTHAHFDHVVALNELRRATHAPVMLHADDVTLLGQAKANAAMLGFAMLQPSPPDRLLRDGDRVHVGELTLQVLHTPGHSPGGICLLCGTSVFAGDTLFKNSIGRTDLPGGNYAALMASIQEKLLILPATTIVYPGHGEKTTIGEERQLNPFLRPLTTGRWQV